MEETIEKNHSLERFFKSIEYIESSLHYPLSIQTVAAAAHYSVYHYCRMFRAIVGDSPAEYIRKRRLSKAAEAILFYGRPILDVAFDCQFNSQEAFTRAFKAQFSITPAQLRKHKTVPRLKYREEFDRVMFHHYTENLTMEPDIVRKPEIIVAGIAKQYNDRDLDLWTLWSAFKPMVPLIADRASNTAFGIYEGYEEEDKFVNFSYICAVDVASLTRVPIQFDTRVIPEQSYAVFSHKGPIENLPLTLKYIWGSWLPKSEYLYTETPDFELYPQGYSKDDASRDAFKMFIPVTPK